MLFASILAQHSIAANVILAVLGTAGFAAILFWLWMAIDCLVFEPAGNQRTAWLLVLLFGSWIGALFYFFLRRRERIGRAVGYEPAARPATWEPPPSPRRSPPLLPQSVAVAKVTEAVPSHPGNASSWNRGAIVAVILGVLLIPSSAVVAGCAGLAYWGLRQTRHANSVMQDEVWPAYEISESPDWPSQPWPKPQNSDTTMEEFRRAQTEILEEFKNAQTEFESEFNQFEQEFNESDSPLSE